jgi:HD-like signal output (HDOD) protein
MIGDYELPSFSATAVATLSLLRDDADMATIAGRIMTDPGLTVRILRTVNSAAFGLRQEASNLTYAVGLLGRSRVEALVLTAAVGEALPAPSVIDMAGFWQRSAQRAFLARKIAVTAHPSTEIESFTAGLLQDMAVPVLAASHASQYATIYSQCESDVTCVLHEMEQDVFGFDHAKVGATMGEAWGLPEPLITAVADHHLAGERAPRAVEAVSHVRHATSPEALESFRDDCHTRLGMSLNDVQAMIEAADSESSSLAESFGT